MADGKASSSRESSSGAAAAGAEPPKAPECKVVLLGGGGVGKSAITLRMVTDNFLDDYDPTIEDNYIKTVVVDGIPVTLDILDTAGQEEFGSMQDQWIRDGMGFLLVYSVIHRQTFPKVTQLFDKIKRIKDDLPKVPIVMIGNKIDMKDSRQIEEQEGIALAKTLGVPFFETSAKEKINIEAAFFEVIREIRRQKPTEQVKAKGCCVLL
jgi:GTPase KRas protein